MRFRTCDILRYSKELIYPTECAVLSDGTDEPHVFHKYKTSGERNIYDIPQELLEVFSPGIRF